MTPLVEIVVTSGAAPVLIPMGAALTVVALVAALATAPWLSTRSQALGRLAAIETASGLYESAPSNPFHDRRASGIPIIESLLHGRTWTGATREVLDRAGIPLRVGEYMALRALTAGLGVMVGLAFAQRVGGGAAVTSFLVVAVGACGWFLPPLVVNSRRKRRQEQIENQLVELCDVIASMLQSGYGYSQALRLTAEQVGAPLSEELQRLLDSVALGGDIDEGLHALSERLGSRDFDMVASAISIQRRSGGNLSEVLAGVATTIRQRQSFFREVRALTARERLSAIIVAAFPLVLVAILCLMAPETYTLLFTDVLGRLILAMVLVLDAIGFVIISKLTKVEV
jgi:tight adherence protein B